MQRVILLISSTRLRKSPQIIWKISGEWQFWFIWLESPCLSATPGCRPQSLLVLHIDQFSCIHLKPPGQTAWMVLRKLSSGVRWPGSTLIPYLYYPDNRSACHIGFLGGLNELNTCKSLQHGLTYIKHPINYHCCYCQYYYYYLQNQ